MKAIYTIPQVATNPDWGIALHLLHMKATIKMSECVICGEPFPASIHGPWEKRYCSSTCQNIQSLRRKKEKRAIALAMSSQALQTSASS